MTHETTSGHSHINRPLPNRLGHNGPYIGGTDAPVERDCQKIPGHTLLFRDLERFEGDLEEAISIMWHGVTDLKIAQDRMANGLEEPETVIGNAAENLSVAFKLMQEAYLIAEVLNDRQERRVAAQSKKDFLALVPSAAPEGMSSRDRLQEEAVITWQVSVLLDRMSYAKGIRQRWPTEDTAQLRDLIDRLEAITAQRSAADLAELDDAALSIELRDLEESISKTRKTISLIHAIRTVRHAQS